MIREPLSAEDEGADRADVVESGEKARKRSPTSVAPVLWLDEGHR